MKTKNCCLLRKSRKVCGVVLVNPADIEQLGNAAALRGIVGKAVHAPAVVEILPDVQVRKQPRVLEHVADVAMMRGFVDARIRIEQATPADRDAPAHGAEVAQGDGRKDHRRTGGGDPSPRPINVIGAHMGVHARRLFGEVPLDALEVAQVVHAAVADEHEVAGPRGLGILGRRDRIRGEIARGQRVVDYLRRQSADRVAVTLDTKNSPVNSSDDPLDLIALDDALIALARSYPRQAQVVELRFFGGLTIEEMAAS